MCSTVIVHSGQQHQGPMWAEWVYSDSYLTSRPACFTGRTISFNFRMLVATEKCAVLCTQREVNQGKTWERERKTNGEWDDETDGERETEICVAQWILQHIAAVFLATVDGGAVLSSAALTSSFFHIQARPVPHLPPEEAAVKGC